MSEAPPALPVPDLPRPPEQVDALFQQIFAWQPGAGGAAPPAQAAAAQLGAYQTYVRKLAAAMEAESRRLAASIEDVQTLDRIVRELQLIEARRRNALAPYLDATAVPAPPTMPPAWAAVRVQLGNDMACELEVMRDARLRLEFRKADLINQRSTPRVRITLRGAAQIRLYFGQRDGAAAKKS